MICRNSYYLVVFAREVAVSSSYLTSEIHLVTATTTLQYERQLSDQQSDIYGIVTLKVSPSILSSNNELLSSTRTRSLENINSTEKKIPSTSLQIDINSSITNENSSQYSNKITNLQLLGDANLSSSTESTNGLPFANENVGTIKQRSPHNQNNNLYNNTSINTMKRSLPIQFFEQSNTHLLKPSYPMTTAIYDNNERYISTNLISPSKQLRKTSTLSPTHLNGRNSSTLNGDKRLQYLKKDQQNKSVK